MTTHKIDPPTSGVPIITLCCNKAQHEVPSTDIFTWRKGGADCEALRTAEEREWEARMRSPEQRATDLETIRDHLDRGTMPHRGGRMWGGLEWAISRVLDIPLSSLSPEPERTTQ